MGGGTREQRGSNLLGSLKNLTTGLIWLVTKVGGWGEAWGGGPWRAGKGGDGGGAPESSVGATKMHWFPFLGSLKNRTTGGRRGEVAHGGRARGRLGEQCGTNKRCTGSPNWLVTRVGGWGEAWGGGPWRAGKGGDGGGAPESSAGATKGAPFRLP